MCFYTILRQKRKERRKKKREEKEIRPCFLVLRKPSLCFRKFHGAKLDRDSRLFPCELKEMRCSIYELRITGRFRETVFDLQSRRDSKNSIKLTDANALFRIYSNNSKILCGSWQKDILLLSLKFSTLSRAFVRFALDILYSIYVYILRTLALKMQAHSKHQIPLWLFINGDAGTPLCMSYLKKIFEKR